MSDEDKEYKRLRSYLNPAIRGKNTDSLLHSLAKGSLHLINNVEAVNDSLYIVKAEDKYLDSRLADRNIVRPDNVGLSDDVFRKLGIQVVNRKQVRDLILQILEVVYGEELTRASMAATQVEPYQLFDNDTLKISFDDESELEIVFDSNEFTNINTATAQEVADAITKQIRKLGRRGAAFVKDDGLGPYVVLLSGTAGPSSSIKVLGGKSNNKLKFPAIRPTSGQPLTQWTLSVEAGGIVRATWTGGPNPSVGKVRVNDYVNIYGSAFKHDLIDNTGTFTITKVKGGLVGQAYVEFLNPNGSSDIVTQGSIEGMLFFNPARKTLSSNLTFATAYQTEERLLEIFLPAVTKVVKRERIGAAYLLESGSATATEEYGPYLWDLAKGYLIGSEECNTVQKVDANLGLVLEVDDATQMPDATGSLIFGFGTQKEEGPVPYIGRPSSNSLLISPSYKFKYVHDVGTNISLVSRFSTYDPASDGTDYPLYLTDVVSGRIYARDLINLVAATGIKVSITVLYPNSEGLSKWGTENDDKAYVWGPDFGQSEE
jgi:hypothetical protein